MSTTEPGDGPIIESRSKVKLTRNAKGDPQWEISVVAGEEADEMTRIRTLAVHQYNALEGDLCEPR